MGYRGINNKFDFKKSQDILSRIFITLFRSAMGSFKNITKKSHAFTLIELIVVITILTILSTIGFVSLTGYFAGTRDSVRLTDMNNIYGQLNLSL